MLQSRISYFGFNEKDLDPDTIKNSILPDLEDSLLDPGNVFLIYWHFTKVIWEAIRSFDYVVSFGGFGRIGEFLVRSLRFDARFDSIPLFTVDFVRKELKGQPTNNFILISYKAYPDVLEFMKNLVVEIRPGSVCKGYITVKNEGAMYGKPTEPIISIFG